ncbi:aldo/keto reductase [Flocculibacter collagenilyticus]|uniref:aldo/keto reductase n=1 Tax=Flocculibacter collagenilyticus TaxID=2744479 RepID=UPI0018F2D117|nr:aldo/keto reductase [Flocculibacter collagenilyticus]
MQLGLGTVQFGLDYGVSNTEGKVSEEQILHLLQYAANNGIDVLDTAIAYGDSEQRLGQVLQSTNHSTSNFKVVTKIPPVTSASPDFVEQIRASLDRLQQDHLHAVMLHDANALMPIHNLTSPPSSARLAIYHQLLELKQQGLCNKIGVSLYNPEQLHYLLDHFKIDIIQVPLNVFDQRFLDNNLLSAAHRAGIEIHTRSAFLQGLLLMTNESAPNSSRPNYFAPYNTILDTYFSQLKAHNITPLEAAIGFLQQQEYIDVTIVGCCNHTQLEEIVKASGKSDVTKTKLDLSQFKQHDEGLIIPSNWTLN